MPQSNLDKLAKQLEKAAFRKSFAKDSLAALSTAGIDYSKIDPDVLGTLSELTPRELRVLSDVKSALRKAKVPTASIANMV